VLHLIDRAQAAHRAARTRRLLGRVARYLGTVDSGVARDGEHGKLSAACVAALETMLGDGRGRAEHMVAEF